jgi:hypothetical protein
MSFDALLGALGVKFIMVIDQEREAALAKRWNDRQREIDHVRTKFKISKVSIDRARPIVLREFGERLAAALATVFGEDMVHLLGAQPATSTPSAVIEGPPWRRARQRHGFRRRRRSRVHTFDWWAKGGAASTARRPDVAVQRQTSADRGLWRRRSGAPLNCAPPENQNTGSDDASNEVAEPPTERDAKDS